MRVLHVISSLDPAAGGVTEFVLTLLRNAAPGDSPEVVTLDDPEAAYLQAVAAPVHALGPVGTTFGYTPDLYPWLRSNLDRFDGVVVHGLWQYTGLATYQAAKHRKPYLVLPHGMLDPYFKHASRLKHLKKWVYWLSSEYWVLRSATRVVFTTREEARLAKQSFWLHRWNEAVIPFGTMPPTGDAAAEKAAFFAQNRHLEGKRVLLFLGRLHPKKGCDLLIEAFARIAAEVPDLHLVMAGPDQSGWSAELQQIASDRGVTERIHWPGMLTGDAKWGALRAAEAFILPSHQENFGIAVAEALACGTPVLLSDKINIAPEIAADHAGYVEPDTLEGTERLLRRWIGTAVPERAQMAANALACFDQRYDLRENIRAIHDLFLSSRSRMR